MDRLLVPLDGSPEAESILAHVSRILRWESSQVVLVRALEPADGVAARRTYVTTLAEAHDYLAQVRKRLEEEGAQVRVRARGGDPRDVILEAAREEDATLIALATHGRAGMARALWGSVAEEVVRHAPVPVLAVNRLRPETETGGRIANILVPLDGSKPCLAVLPHALEFARRFESRLSILHVLEPRPAPPYGDVVADFIPRQRAAEWLHDIAAGLATEGVEVRILIEEGTAVRLIPEFARREQAGLIAMTTHGRSGLSRLVLGSVTEQVLRTAEAPLLIVRAGN